MINALTRIKYVPLAYIHASLHMNAILMTLMLNERNTHDINANQHVAHVRHKIASTNLLHCIKEAHKLHTISLQASNPVSLNTSFFLQAEGQDVSNTGDLSPIRQQHGKHHSSDANKTTCSSDSVIWATHETYYLLYANNMASITQVMITRLHAAQRVWVTQVAYFSRPLAFASFC